MRDHLEELLELAQLQEEEQASRELLEQALVLAVPPAGRGEAGRAGWEENGQPDQDGAEVLKQEVRSGDDPVRAAQKERDGTDPGVQGRGIAPGQEGRPADILAQEEQAEGAGVLRTLVVQAGQQVRYRGSAGSSADQGQAAAVWLKSGPAERAAVQVRRVDRAFERDARRYDSGFTLF